MACFWERREKRAQEQSNVSIGGNRLSRLNLNLPPQNCILFVPQPSSLEDVRYFINKMFSQITFCLEHSGGQFTQEVPTPHPGSGSYPSPGRKKPPLIYYYIFRCAQMLCEEHVITLKKLYLRTLFWGPPIKPKWMYTLPFNPNCVFPCQGEHWTLLRYHSIFNDVVDFFCFTHYFYFFGGGLLMEAFLCVRVFSIETVVF